MCDFFICLTTQDTKTSALGTGCV